MANLVGFTVEKFLHSYVHLCVSLPYLVAKLHHKLPNSVA